MIQPEPEDLPKDNPKLEIEVCNDVPWYRIEGLKELKKKCMDKGSKERSPPLQLKAKNGVTTYAIRIQMIAGIENDIMDPVHKLLSRVLRNIIVIFARTFRVILFSIHNDEWKSFQCHHQTALRSTAGDDNPPIPFNAQSSMTYNLESSKFKGQRALR
ncbi:hypothetical protein Tco_0073218 [Tanacetum coccineum]